LRRGDVARRLDESLELAVRHRRAIDPEAADRHAMDRRLFGVMVIRAHGECAAGNPDHVAGLAVLGLSIILLDVGSKQYHRAPLAGCAERCKSILGQRHFRLSRVCKFN